MAGDLSKPVVADTYTAFASGIRDNFDSQAKMHDGTGVTNPPTGTIRWNSTSRYWEKNTGTAGSPAWSKLVDEASAAYAIRVNTADAWTTGRTITLTGDVTGASASWTGSGNISFATTLATVPATKGGTGQTSYAVGNLLYASSTTALSKLAPGTGFLKASGGAPSWATLASADLPATISSKTFDYTNTYQFDDNKATFRDQTNTSRTMQFDLGGLTTDGARTIALPDYTGSQTLLFTSLSQSVTYKTFGTGCTWNGGTISVGYGGTGATTLTNGGILVGTTTSAIRASAAISGLVYGNGTSVPTAASAAQIVAAIGTTAVTNATNATSATNATNLTGSGTISSTTTGTTQAAGTNNTRLATTAFVKTEIDATGCGRGQTWQDVTGSRNSLTNYTNSTGRPIMVSVASLQGTTGYAAFTIDGVTGIGYESHPTGANSSVHTVTVIVPPGGVYALDTNSTVSSWHELR